MKIGILQPGYLPWLGFFEQVHSVDVFVIYDDVQYDKHGWRNRNRIKAVDGLQWLTVPVLTKGLSGQEIREVRIDHKSRWAPKHLRSLETNYRKAPHYGSVFRMCEEVLSIRYERLLDLNLAFLRVILEKLRIGTRVVLSSSLNIRSDDRMRKLAEICRAFRADTFYEGKAGRDYIDTDFLSKEGVRVVFQDYRHPVYPQMHGDFVSHLSVVDLLMNCGEKSLDILTNGTAGSGRFEP